MALLTNINGKFSVSDAGAVTFNNAFTFPTADGNANYVLQTNGSGQIGWAENGSVTGSGSATRVAFWSSGSAITSDADLYWDNTNKRLGIGTAGPSALLEISGIRENQIRLTSRDTTAAIDETIGGIEFYSSDSGNEGVKASISAIAANAAGSAYMTFNTGTNLEGMRIDSSGDTHLQGNLFFEGSTSYVAGYSIRRQGANFIFTGGTTGTFFNRNGNGATDMYINASGLVGIGATVPTNQLHVHTETDNAYGIRIEGSTNNVAGVWTGLGIGGENANTKSALLFEDTVGSYARGKLHLCVNNGADQTSATPADAKLTIIPSGNVGIGTTSPGRKLTVTGDASGDANNLLLVNENDTDGDSASIGFSMLSSNDYVKAGIFFKRTTTQGRGDLIFATNNEANGNNVTLSNARLTIKSSARIEMSADVTMTGSVGIGETTLQRKFNLYDGTDTWTRVRCGASTADWLHGIAGSDHTYKWYNQSSNGGVGNKMAIATSGTLTVSADIVAYGSPSDIRLKENIKPIESALDKAMKLQGVTFDWKESDSILDIKEDIGFIAQDVQKVIPELVRENEDGMLSMRHQGIAPILLEAIKELKAEIEELKLNKCNCNK